MKISTKGRYALRLMLDLALNNNGEPVQIKDISVRQNISNKYLEQIVSALNKAGMVRSIRGPQGGYMLAKKPADYTVGDILRVMEGSMAPVSCLEFEENTCPRENTCATLMVWKRLDEAIKGVIDSITLENLVEEQMSKSDLYII